MNSSSTPSPFNSLPSWILVLIAVFVPSAFGITSYKFITQHPLQAFGWLCLFESVIVFVAIVRLLWKNEFQNDFVKEMANQLRSRIAYPLGYQRYYCYHLYHVYGFVQKLALPVPSPLKLERVFVEPTFVPEPYDKISSNPIALPKESSSVQNSIWYFLASEEAKTLLILGAAGMGKSTLMQFIALRLVNRMQRLQIETSYNLPFLLSLHEFSDELKKNEELSLADAIKTQIGQRWRRPPPNWIERRLKKGHCLILLDGLDEIADLDIRQLVVRWVQWQIDTYDNNRFVITSRPLSHRDNPLNGVTSLEIQGFSNKQIDEFVNKMYQEMKEDSAQAEELKKRLHESKYKFHKLARNPLLLGMVISVHQYRGTLPESRVELYKAIFEVYLGERWREVSPTKDVLLATEKQKILQTLAYKMMEMEGQVQEIEPSDAVEIIRTHFENLSITPEQFLQSAENTGIWILGQISGQYRFAHLSFQEYLAATYIKDIRRPELIVNHINYREVSWWRETIVLYCAQADPTPILTACLIGTNRLSEDALDLALDLYLEPEVQKATGQQVKPEVRERFDQAVSLSTEDKDIDLRHKIANALLNRREQILIPDGDMPVEDDAMIDTSFINNAEYQLFLDQQQYHNRQPDHWQFEHFPTGKGMEPVLGMRPSDAKAFCNWLVARASGAWHYRLPTSEETPNISRGVGKGYWTDNSGFVWLKGQQLSPNKISLTLLDGFLRLSADDDYFALNTPPYPEERDLAKGIFFAGEFTGLQKQHKNLIDFLHSVRERLASYENNLQIYYKRARIRKEDLDNKIIRVRTNKSEAEKTLKNIADLRAQLVKVSDKKAAQQTQLSAVNENKAKVLENLLTRERKKAKLRSQLLPKNNNRIEQKNLAQQVPLSSDRILQSNLAREQIATINRKIAELDEQRKLIVDQEQVLKEKFKNASEQQGGLLEQLQGANETEKITRQQLLEATQQENILAKQLEDARKDSDRAEQQLSSFKKISEKFDLIYNFFSDFRSTDKVAISADTFARNQILNLDRSLVFRENKKVLDLICAFINTRIRDFTNYLEQLSRESDAFFTVSNDRDTKSNISHALTIARDLANKFDLIVSSEYFQHLDRCLSAWLRLFSQNRSLLRRNKRVRLYIRYFAKVLAQHLSYWSPEELFLSTDQLSSSQSTYLQINSLSQRYFDSYLAFLLLEERINENITACEGILIVREHKREVTNNLTES